MSEPKLISPMLDNFEMGNPISEHDGVRCCPAMRKNSDDKYIVKIISVPATQTKLDALLLTGAYPDKVSALSYFHEVAKGIEDEKKVLDTLANLEGFVSFEDSQIIPMDDGTGYDVYLLSEYRMTLERKNARNCMTQLSAVNLALDLCAALAVCRRSGYMCVDLKPSNIYIVGDKDYRIGDLGFVRINSLKYESLPDMYRSSYTAPEAEDAFAPLNDTMDVYALGLILYQIYNGGKLPFTGKIAPSEEFETPAYADEEIAEIILKACDPNPQNRWQDPVQMGQAIVNYMQKNGVNDTPIVPISTEKAEEVPAIAVVETIQSEIAAMEENSEANEQIVAVHTEETAVNSESDFETAKEVEAIEENSVFEDTFGFSDDDQEPVSDLLQYINDLTAETEAEDSTPIWADTSSDSETLSEDTDETSSEQFEEEEYDNLSFLDELDDETANVLADIGDDYDGVTDELSVILGQIDELTAHQIPEPIEIKVPDPIEIKIPDPVEPKEPLIPEADPDAIAEEVASVVEAATTDPVQEFESDIPEEELPYIPKKRTGLVWLIVLTILVALAAGAYFFYTLYYLQPIHTLIVNGSEDRLNVQLTADIDESLLTIVCADSHGNKTSAPVVSGQAIFSGLAPDTAYTVSVEVDGFHKLTGTTSKIYSTPMQTKIMQMNAVTGSESGSVILSFTVEGPDSEQWNVIYNAEGEAERVTAFPAHMVTLAGLTVGKEYSFRLEPVDDVYLSGNTEIVYTAKNLICAENLHVTACSDGELTAQWDIPEGAEVTEWSIRCYNQSGYDQTIVTPENTVTFQGIDDTTEHTVEVTAADMSVSQRITVGANSVTVSDFFVDNVDPSVLVLTWNTNRETPAEGWTIRYSVNGINAPTPINTTENSVEIPAIPDADYVFTILDGSGNPVLGGPFTHTQSGASDFNAYGVSLEDITTRLCKTPSASSWSYKDLEDEDYMNSFSTGEKISVVLALAEEYEDSDESVNITFAVYDEGNNLISFSHSQQNWQSMWYQNYCELDVSGVPSEIGTYNLVIYFNGTIAGSQKFEITA